MVTHYVEDYDGERNEDAAEPLTLGSPVSSGYEPETKVVAPGASPKAPKKTARAETKKKG